MAPEVLHDLSNQEQLPPANTIFCTHGCKTGRQWLQHHIPTELLCIMLQWHLQKTSCFMGGITGLVWLRQGSFLAILSSRRPSALASLYVLHHVLYLPFSTNWGTTSANAVHKPVERENTKSNFLLVPPKLRWRMFWSCLHAAWRYCHNHKSW